MTVKVCSKNKIKIEKRCHLKSKKITSLDADIVHALFRKHQKKYGVTEGGVHFDFLMPLEHRIEQKGSISLEELDREVSRYYKIHYGGK